MVLSAGAGLADGDRPATATTAVAGCGARSTLIALGRGYVIQSLRKEHEGAEILFARKLQQMKALVETKG